jgi:hypothetical protein
MRHAVRIKPRSKLLLISLHVENCRQRKIRCLHAPALSQTSDSRRSEIKEKCLRTSRPASSTSARHRSFIRGCSEYATILSAGKISDGFQFCVEDVLH